MRHIGLIVVAATAGVLVAACGSSAPSYFLASNGSAVLLVEWGQVSNGQASGNITYDSRTGTAPDESVSVETVPVTTVTHPPRHATSTDETPIG